MSDTGAPRVRIFRSGRARLLVMSGFFLAVSALGLLSVYHLFAGKSLSFDNRLIQAPVVLTAVALLLVYFLADGLRLHYCLRALGYKLPGKLMARLVFINMFFSNVTPMATGGGLAQIWYLQRYGVPVSHAGAATSIRTLLAVILIFIGAPLYLLLQQRFDATSLVEQFGPAVAVLALFYVLGLSILIFRSRWLIAPASGLLRELYRRDWVSHGRHRRLQFRLKRGVIRFSRSFVDFLHGDRRAAWLSLFWTTVFLASLFSIPALLISGLGYPFPYVSSVGIALLTTFVMYFAPTPGAAGISEGVFAGFLQTVVSPGHLILIVVLWRFLSIYLGMLIGLVIIQSEMRRMRVSVPV